MFLLSNKNASNGNFSPGGGYSWEFLVGVCCPVLYILTLFQTKKCCFPHPFSDQTSKIHIRPFSDLASVVFNSWMALYPAIGYKSIQWITQLVSLILIRWIAIYPVDIAIQRLNNRGLAFRQKLCYLYLD